MSVVDEILHPLFDSLGHAYHDFRLLKLESNSFFPLLHLNNLATVPQDDEGLRTMG